MVDAGDSKSSAARLASSSLASGTTLKTRRKIEWGRSGRSAFFVSGGAVQAVGGRLATARFTKIRAPLMRDDPQYRYDVLETRQIIELSTAWYAAQRATTQDKDHIRRCYDEMLRHQRSQDAASSARADAQFHLAIAEASHNVVVVQVMRSLFEMVLNTVAQNRRLMFVHDDPKVLERLTLQHHDLMQAVVAGEPEQARTVITEHLAFVHEKLSQADADAARQQRQGRLAATGLTFS